MGKKLDTDLKSMTAGQLRQEVMKLRNAMRLELNNTGNRRCWVNLLRTLPEYKGLRPLSLSRCKFLGNCAKYYDRNQK